MLESCSADGGGTFYWFQSPTSPRHRVLVPGSSLHGTRGASCALLSSTRAGSSTTTIGSRVLSELQRGLEYVRGCVLAGGVLRVSAPGRPSDARVNELGWCSTPSLGSSLSFAMSPKVPRAWFVFRVAERTEERRRGKSAHGFSAGIFDD